MQKCMGKHYEVREFEKINFHPFLIFFHALKLALKQHNNKIILFVVLVPNKGLKYLILTILNKVYSRD